MRIENATPGNWSPSGLKTNLHSTLSSVVTRGSGPIDYQIKIVRPAQDTPYTTKAPIPRKQFIGTDLVNPNKSLEMLHSNDMVMKS